MARVLAAAELISITDEYGADIGDVTGAGGSGSSELASGGTPRPETFQLLWRRRNRQWHWHSEHLRDGIRFVRTRGGTFAVCLCRVWWPVRVRLHALPEAPVPGLQHSTCLRR